MSGTDLLPIDTDGLIKIKKLYNEKSAAYVNDATITAILKDADESNTIITGPITFTYVTSSNGEYMGSWDKADPSPVLIADDVYVFIITIDTAGIGGDYKKYVRAGYPTID